MDLTGFATINMLGSGSFSAANASLPSYISFYLFDRNDRMQVYRSALTNGSLGDFSFNLQGAEPALVVDHPLFDLSKINSFRWEISVWSWPETATLSYVVDEINFSTAAGPVPEPLTMLTGLLAIGGFGVYVRRHARMPGGPAGV